MITVSGEELERLTDELRVALVGRYLQDMGPQARQRVWQMAGELAGEDRRGDGQDGR